MNIKRGLKSRSGFTIALFAIGFLFLGFISSPFANATNWNAITQCESGGNPTAQNPHSSASGLYQITDGTWGGYGGYAHAKDAPVAVQTAKAMTLPLSAWNASRSCWASKQDAPAKVIINSAPVHVRPKMIISKKIIVPHPVEIAPVQVVATTGNYVIMSGDTLSEIATSHNIVGGWTALWDLNKGSISDPNLIFPGQALSL